MSARFTITAVLLATCVPAGCGGVTSGPTGEPLVRIDGSSSVYPITEAVAEEFQNKNQGVRVTVDVSGTSGGFQKFCRGETDLANASRAINAVELERCAKAGITFLELPVAYDGLAVIVNPKNTWADQVAVAELRALWAPDAQAKITRWNQVRAGWPDRPIHLYGPAASSDTFEYFTDVIGGGTGASRGDYTSSEDDNALVRAVASDELALGFVVYASFDQNKRTLRALPVDDGRDDDGKGPIPPSPETVRNGTYQPLSRPLFIYVSQNAIGRPEVRSFVDYYLKEGPWLIDQGGGIQLGDKGYELVRRRLTRGVTGSAFPGESPVRLTLDQMLARLQ